MKRDIPGAIGLRAPVAAYRKSLALLSGPEPDDPEHGAWIAAATLLHHSVSASETQAARLIEEAVALSVLALGQDAVNRGCPLDPPSDPDRRATGDIFRLLAERIEDSGLLPMAANLLEVLEVALPLSVVDAGRVLAHRARIAWKSGDLDIAMARYRTVERLGSEHEIPELQVRAWVGYSTLAQQRGNYPELREWANRIIAVADREGFVRLGALARGGLMRIAAAAGRFDESVVLGWAVYRATVGDPVANASALQNLSQLLLEAGHWNAARAGFAALLSQQQHPRVAIGATGGLAVACAALGEAQVVRWLGREITTIARGEAHHYQVAVCLYECSEALATIGDAQQSAALRDKAFTIANAHGFHEITFRADEKAVQARTQKVAVQPFGPNADVVERNVVALDPGVLPDHLSFAVSGV